MSEDIVITGIGMMSSLGGSVSACASARAGITRPSPLDVVVCSPDTLYPEKVSGHPCVFAQGFQGYARLAYLLGLAYEDLRSTSGIHGLNERNTAFFLNMPSSDERPLLRNQLGGGMVSDPETSSAAMMIASCRSFKAADVLPDETTVLEGGHAGMIHLLEEAERCLRSREKKWCLIGGVDSYIDTETQDWLAATNRLKTPNIPNGLMPGEGAAILLMELRETALERHAVIQAVLGPHASAMAGYSFDNPDPYPSGKVLSDSIVDVLNKNENKAGQVNTIITDLNGIDVRAKEWGYAIPSCASVFPAFLDMGMETPAESFGDVGAASAGFFMCSAVRALIGGYSQGNELLICSSSEHGQRGAMIIKNTL